MADPIYLPKRPHDVVVKLNYDSAVETLGKICVEFQRLESHLKVAIADLLDPHDSVPGMIVTAQVSFKAILDLFGALFEHRFNDPALQKKLAKFLDQCKAAEDRRNQVIHSHWEPDIFTGKGAVRRKSTARGKLKTEQQVLSQADL
jgi:hypothetical protein